MDDSLSLLRKYWGYDGFRGIQREIIESISSGKDTLGLMPTGGGKSLTFQLPALMMEGTCLVITPLKALMKDQVESLVRRGIKAAYIHSGMPHEKAMVAMENCILGAYKFLYVSPERLASQSFLAKLSHMKVSFVTVDEAHCICQWGYDFRPSYLQIATIRDILPDAPFLALTATATPEVARDIQRVLGFREENVFRMSFFRSNLAYKVCDAFSRYEGLLHALREYPGSCIVYVRSRERSKELADSLSFDGFSATYYHAGLEQQDKDLRQDAWQRGEYRIMVATNAFGMGIDKPDVRLVVHVDVPDSIEAYFQEAGRAGRDGKPACSIIVIDKRGLVPISTKLEQAFPCIDYIRDSYEKVCCYLGLAVGDGFNVTREFDIGRFCRTFGFFPNTLRNALALLDKAGYIEYHDEEEAVSRLHIRAARDELFRSIDDRCRLVVRSLFRNYGGLFVDYVYMDESLVARDAGLSADDVYHTLADLSKAGLVSYIPRKRLPRVTFRCRRVETSDVVLPYNVYKRQKDAYEYRLKAMYRYCSETHECRSRMLLRYFGEDSSDRCGICDRCESQSSETLSEEEYEEIRGRLLALMHRGPVLAWELREAEHSEAKLTEVLDIMQAREELLMDGAYVCLNKQKDFSNKQK